MLTKQAGPLPLPEEALEDFFEQALAAASKAELSTRRAKLGAITLDLHIGSGFQEKNWTAPLAISSTENEAEVSLYVWEESRRSTGFPPPPWGNRYVYSHRGDIQGYNHPEIQVAFSQHSRVLSLYHRTRRLGIFWTPSLTTLPGYEWAGPMRWLINWIGLERGLQLTHAGAVGLQGRGLLLAGKGGSGKSTTSLACWSAGWDFVSDDYCWLSSHDHVEAHAVYKTAKLIPDQPVDLPDWDRVARLSDEKSVYQLDELRGGRLADVLRIEALLLPAIRQVDRPGLREASPRDALAALSLSTLAQLPGTGAESMSILKKAVETLPAYHLDLCHPVSAVPSVLKELLS